MPKHGSIATYTPLAQSTRRARCQGSAAPLPHQILRLAAKEGSRAEKFDRAVVEAAAASRQQDAENHMLRNPLRTHAHTVTACAGKVMPFGAISNCLVAKFIAE